ncbi:heptahelical transmembrane 1-like [Olea europaea subsp. europaea]|uniref:Heptahelical transmembrane 1-like n=1 Tax=Olea europaea subsp. europaea TaxID=158383 RepID=A0A8S0Q165_OLEEU|nr:heptahelical transmembrane 1-like [Olea europaea subsp. europaea]
MNSTEGSVWQRKIEGKMDQEKDQTASFFSQDSAISCKKKIGKTKRKIYPLLSFHELPDYMKDNEYILNYYRVNWPLKEAFFSLFRWHNETLNVWTHLVGFVLFLGLTICNLTHVPQVADFITMFTGQFPSSADANMSHNSKDFSLVSTSHQFYENHIRLAYRSKNEFLTLQLFRYRQN